MTPTATTEQPIVIVCAWCPDSQEQTEKARRDGAAVSHGICEKCLPKFEAEAKDPRR